MIGEGSKTLLAQALGISRSTLYYVSRKDRKDWTLKARIEDMLRAHPAYGSRRIAQALCRNRKGVQRVMRRFGIRISRSHPGCPWENGYQESFYDKFKVDLDDANRFRSLGELVAEIYRTVWAYKNTRIHSALTMPPKRFIEIHALVAEKSLRLGV